METGAIFVGNSHSGDSPWHDTEGGNDPEVHCGTLCRNSDVPDLAPEQELDQ